MAEHEPVTNRKKLGLVTLAFSAAALVAAVAPRAAMAQDYSSGPAYDQDYDQSGQDYDDQQSAQGYDDQDADDTGVPTAAELDQRMLDVQARIDDALDDGAITQFTANRDLDELANIRTQANELRERDGELTLTDLQFIDGRLDRLDGRVRYALNR